MKILIKIYQDNLNIIEQRSRGEDPCLNHVAPYWNFMLRAIFEDLGHDVSFIGPDEDEGIHPDRYDLLIFHELESFLFDREFSLNLLKDFKGKKAFYIPTIYYEDKEIMEQFDYIFPAECPQYLPYWKRDFPNKNITTLPWHAPRKSDVDIYIRDRIFLENGFNLIYTGIVIDKYLDMIIKLADSGETVYLGGTYHKTGEKQIRAFTSEEIKSFPKNIKLISPNGMFNFGEQFKYLKAADLGLVFYPINGIGCVKHKLTEYLICGLPSVVEEPTPNAFRVKELSAGRAFKFNDFDDLYRAVQEEKETRRNRFEIEAQAWKVFNPVSVCQELLEVVSK